MLIAWESREIWFVTGSQHLYGEETLTTVAENSAMVAKAFDSTENIPVAVKFKAVVTTPQEIVNVCREANNSTDCIGLIFWMHTFSPAKMWIAGLSELKKPFLHLHTQYNRDIPWDEIDMDFMNLNQTAHGGREFGYICTRLGLNRTVIAGHWNEPEVRDRVGIWARAAAAWQDMRTGSIARLGDNMREVAVTEGDKVSAQIALGFSCNGYGMGDVVQYIDTVSEAEIDHSIDLYSSLYTIQTDLMPGGEQHNGLREAARLEIGLRAFLEQGGFTGFTTTFENLTGLSQLPGLACQRLMADGYGFGAEGDWKTAALVRAMKIMADGLPGGTSFMEDYTYHLDPDNSLCLGAHMLEVCPSIMESGGKAALEIEPLSIGGKEDPARLTFSTAPGPAMNVSIIDMGNRFRLLANMVDTITPPHDMPKLPVARVLWKPHPDLRTAATAWIHAGGAHHTAFTNAFGIECIEDFARMCGLELVIINKETTIRDLQNELRWNDASYAKN